MERLARELIPTPVGVNRKRFCPVEKYTTDPHARGGEPSGRWRDKADYA